MDRHTASLSPGSLLPCLLLLFLGVAVADEERPPSGEFSGQWNVTGRQQTLEFIDGRQVAITRHRGEVNLKQHDWLPGAFSSTCIGFSDSGTGGVVRCQWVDSADNRLFIEATTKFIEARSLVRGEIVGGSGKYEGISGTVELEAWTYVTPDETESRIYAYTDSLRGTWSFE
ncbi:MAG: hypothetical protein ACR2QU_06325 [Gammaproteobacteria bacterium]